MDFVRTRSDGDMFGAWAHASQLHRPLKQSHRGADALLDPTVETLLSSRRTSSEADERELADIVGAMRKAFRCRPVSPLVHFPSLRDLPHSYG